MCAIAGYIGHVAEGLWGERFRLLESLLLAAEDFGKDASGFVAETEPYKNSLAKKIIIESICH